jgi:flap endonuclease-1
MGVQITDIIPKKEIELKDLKGKTIAIDAFNTLYQFLTTIRQADGTPLMDSKGNVTSHLSGLLYRNINLLLEGIKPIYVFDGKPPELKYQEIERRKEAKDLAQEKYEEAKEKGDLEEMKKYSSRTVKMTDKIISESKELLEALGIPVIKAESEGEAEAALMARNNLVWASASQDFDSLLYGTPKLIRNLTLARKRKTSSGLLVDTKMELIEFEDVLNKLQISNEQLICLAILVGTDYNPGGVKGIGQKRALEIVQKYQFPVKIFEYVQNSEKYTLDFDWQQVFKQFHQFKAKTINSKEIQEKKINIEKLKEILVTRHEFSEERINNAIEKLSQIEKSKKQKGLSEFW